MPERLVGVEVLHPDDLDGLLERPLVAVLATYGADSNVLLSPVSGIDGETAASTS